VNARGLDLRLRLPEGMVALETAARAALATRLSRGAVTLTLRLSRTDAAQAAGIDLSALDRALLALGTVQERAAALGVMLAPPTAAEVLAQRGVVGTPPGAEGEDQALTVALSADLDLLLVDFLAMRRTEGATLRLVLQAQLDEIAALIGAGRLAAQARIPESREVLRNALQRVLGAAAGIDEGRVAQELALIAIKADITEEIDRLGAHVAAARTLLDDPRPVGRKLDFLAQEFNREANTLCSKAQSEMLTRIGLDLKSVIDQMREQVQNVE